MTTLSRLNSAIDAGITKSIFDHLRNYLICALLFAAGMHVYNFPSSSFFGLFKHNYSGSGIIFIACLLSLLNFYDGVRKLARYRFNLLIIFILFMIYVFFSVRIVEIIFEFRSSI